jgi:hypothetical protein
MDPRREVRNGLNTVIQSYGGIQNVINAVEQKGCAFREPLLSLANKGRFTVALISEGGRLDHRSIHLGNCLAVLIADDNKAGPDAWPELPSILSKVARVFLTVAPRTAGQYAHLAKKANSLGSILVVETSSKTHAEWLFKLNEMAPEKLDESAFNAG